LPRDERTRAARAEWGARAARGARRHDRDVRKRQEMEEEGHGAVEAESGGGRVRRLPPGERRRLPGAVVRPSGDRVEDDGEGRVERRGEIPLEGRLHLGGREDASLVEEDA